MKKSILLLPIFILSFSLSLFAQQKDSLFKFPILIKFNSICCGVPSDSLLRKSIIGFKRKNKLIQIAAFKISPMGKEGEYYLGFTLKEVSNKKRSSFIQSLSEIIPLMNDKGIAVLERDFLYNKADYPTNVRIEKVVFK